MTEWNPSGNTWNEAWDDGSGSAGFAVAESIHQTFAEANAYVYWVATSLGATRGFIQIADGSDAYRVSKRFWAFAAYSRFIRPGGVRVPVQFTDPNLTGTGAWPVVDHAGPAVTGPVSAAVEPPDAV